MMKKVFAVSILAIMAVSAANAKIVSETMLNTAISDMETKTNAAAPYQPKGSYATSTQGSKADSAIQGVKLNGTALTPDSSKVVSISAATTAQGSKADSAIQTVKVNGTALTADSSKAVDVTVPTKVSQLTNDSGYLTSHQDISGKMDKVVAADKNGVIVRKSDGTAMKGTGSDIAVSDAGAITVTHALSADSATTATTANGVAWGNVSGKPSTFAPSAHNQASNTITAMTDYSKPSTTSAIATTDSLNAAIGKLEKALDGKQASGNYLTAHQDISGKENTTNKVTSISSASTDAQYPSAKAVYTAVDARVAKSGHTAKGVLSTNSSGAVVDGTISGGGIVSVSVNDSGNITVSASHQDISGKQDKSNIVTATGDALIEDSDTMGSTTKYPSMATMNSAIGEALSETTGNVAGIQNTMVKHAANTAVGSATQPIYVDENGDAKAGTALGTMAYKGAVTTSEITNGTIVNDDISESAAIAQSKINGLTTALSNAQNKIPSGSENSTTLASIWVE